MRRKRKITHKLSAQEPEKDYEEIVLLLQCYGFPRDDEQVLEFSCFAALRFLRFHLYCAKPASLSGHLCKRYDDTALLFQISQQSRHARKTKSETAPSQA